MKKGLKLIAIALITVCALSGVVACNKMSFKMKDRAEVGFTAIEAAVLKQGSQGDLVKTVQQKLKRWGYYNGAVDGIYGSQTRAAVVYFQKKNGLVADGIVGAKTMAALGMSASSTTPS